MKGRESPDWFRVDFEQLTFDQRREVADRITAERKRRKLSQRELSSGSGVPLRTIVHMDSGGTPQADTLRKLTDALDSSETTERPNPATEQMFIDMVMPLFRQLSEPGRVDALRDIMLTLGTGIERERRASKEAARQIISPE